jgi:hypothetical protein
MFRKTLTAAWAVYVLGIALFFAFPRQVVEITRWPLLRLWLFGYSMVILVLASGVYVLVELYRAGMRSAGKGRDPE